MTTLVVGANGATGRLLVTQLLGRGEKVVAVVRSADSLPEEIRNHNNLTLAEASILDMNDAELNEYVKGCDAVASCLGHNITFRGLFGHPRRLVTGAVEKLCRAVKTTRPEQKTKFVLMNTTGNQNRDIDEPIPIASRLVVGLIRSLLPPHADNERAADYLRIEVGQDDENIEWVVVRPDGLIDEESVTEYQEHESPTRDPIFNAGQTSRINVAHFMAELLADKTRWGRWKGKMPVIYNAGRP